MIASVSSANSACGFDADNVLTLARIFSQINFADSGPPDIPWGNRPSARAFSQAIASGVHHLPLVYEHAYIEPLRRRVGRVLRLTQKGGGTEPAETLLGAVYEHAPGAKVAPQLRRFLAVVSDLYRSFLSREKRAGLAIPLIEWLPPLAAFKSSGVQGPFTYPASSVEAMTGSRVGVVSLPSSYRDHPLLWAALAHETGGHDILHADPGLLDELSSGIRGMFDGLAYQGLVYGSWLDAGTTQLLGYLWSYWCDETASDVYGILNIGPEFALSFIPWLAALRMRLGGLAQPALLTNTLSGPGNPLDSHPTDILRIFVAIGVIESLCGLGPQVRLEYVQLLNRVAYMLAGGVQQITIQGEIPGHGSNPVPINLALPVPIMASAAALVGRFIASVPLRALSGRSIQQIETWDDSDEAAARRVAREVSHCSLRTSFDAAQLLAGSILAALRNPDAYKRISKHLGESLDRVFDRDPVWKNHSANRE